MPWWKSGNSALAAGDAAPKPPQQPRTPADKAANDGESLVERTIEGHGPDSTDTNLRYAAYAARLRTLLSSAHRYVAYTSDLGESLRPVAHIAAVRAAYAVSWVYVAGDVANEGYRAYRRAHDGSSSSSGGAGVSGDRPAVTAVVDPLDDYRAVMARRAIFQSVASMGLPALTIHTVVRYAGRAMRPLRSAALRTWGPVALGFAIVPFLPAMFDHPVETAVERIFRGGLRTYSRLVPPLQEKEKEL